MKICILGNGISGITAARYLRKYSQYEILVISAESPYFFSRTALMYLYMGHMKSKHIKPYPDDFWEKNNIDLCQCQITEIQFENKVLIDVDGNRYGFDKLILATGSKTSFYGWKGQDLDGVCGLYNIQDLQKIENYSKQLKRAVIVGGGLIGIELAEMFHSRHIPVTFLVRESSFWNIVLPAEESALINNEIRANGIDLRLNTELKEIIGNDQGKCTGVICSDGTQIDCGFVGITAGVRPNIDFLRGSNLELDRGILVDDFLKTNIQDVYAIGDCAQMRNPQTGRRPIEAVWYTGRIMGETLAYNICREAKPYNPGIWFNSAKFFDIEYHVYGNVLTDPPPEQISLYWEHKQGRKSLRLVYHRETKAILGFNVMGMRFRHEVCDKWLEEGTMVQEVIKDLALANFDPEFCRMHLNAIYHAFSEQLPGPVEKPKAVRSHDKVIQFLKS